MKFFPKGILELWDRVEEEWSKIPSDVCQNLIESIPRCIEAVLKGKGSINVYTNRSAKKLFQLIVQNK